LPRPHRAGLETGEEVSLHLMAVVPQMQAMAVMMMVVMMVMAVATAMPGTARRRIARHRERGGGERHRGNGGEECARGSHRLVLRQ
jgi:uncharacterized membrane-anchored protein